MTAYDFDLGVIGAGAAGLTVAAGAAQLGAKTLLIEKEPRLGGDCLHYGCVPSKTLIRSATIYHRMKHAPDFGLPPVDVPPVDFTAVARRIQSVIDAIQEHDSVERFCGLGAQVEFGRPVFVDSHAVLLHDRRVSAKNWVIATGSSPQTPPLPGLDRTPHLTNRDLFSLTALPRSLAVLGAGPVAVEMAQAFNRLGTRVTVVQRSGRILSKEDPDLADALMDALAREGVDFRLKTTVAEIRDLGREREIILKDEDGALVSLKAEQILVALGRTPNVDGLGLDRIGIDVDSRGVKVDRRLRTAQKHIFAAGDVCGGPQFTHAAGYEGGLVVANAVFRLPRKVDYTWMPRCTFTDPELAGLGLNETDARKAGLKYSVWTEEFRDNDRAWAEGRPVGRIKMILDDKQNPVGVQILGPHAGELINEWVAVLGGRVKLSTLASAVHPYPTLGEINKRVAGRVLSTKLFSDRVRKGLKLVFQLKGRACDPET